MKPGFTIETRQKADLLFSRRQVPDDGGSIFTFDTKKVIGYDSIRWLIISDLAFTLEILEGCGSAEGDPFPVTASFFSVTSDAFQKICETIRPCGSFMFARIEFTGVVGSFLFACGRGLPTP